MTPEYLDELADIADSDSLWRLPLMAQLELPEHKRRQLDAGIALRRYAEHRRMLLKALKSDRSVLITLMSENSTAIKIVDTPPDHAKSRALTRGVPACPGQTFPLADADAAAKKGTP
jgi:hypothetical protein